MDINKIEELNNILNNILEYHGLLEIDIIGEMEHGFYYYSNYPFQYATINHTDYWKYTINIYRFDANYQCLERIVLEVLLEVKSEKLRIRNIINGDDYINHKFETIVNTEEVKLILKSILLQEFDNKRIVQYSDFLNNDR